MKIVLINGSLPHYDFGLAKVTQSITGTLIELGIEIDEVSLGFTSLPYFDGMRAQVMDDISARLRAASGVIFACTVQLSAPCAMMNVLLEFLQCEDYKNVLFEKHCMLAMVSKQGGERTALDYLARVISGCGGYESTRLGLQEAHTSVIRNEAEAPPGSIRDIIEKTTEDFYRAVRQNRKYIIAADTANNSQPQVKYIQPSPQIPEYTQPAQQPVYTPPVQQPVYAQPAQQPVYTQPEHVNAGKLNLESFTEQQEQDIKELTALFSQKYVQPDNSQYYDTSIIQPQRKQQINSPVFRNTQSAAPPKPRTKTVKQLTQSLPHYYQPQMAAGLTALMQFSITGAETFDGYLTIVDNECDYNDGRAENPEITIISDSAVWRDVLNGKHTAQKAFMIGGLKVRGNFVLLTKFDTLFKLG